MKKVGEHLRISVWYLLTNLKNSCLLKNCWSGPIKNVGILIFPMLHFPKKAKKNTWRYHYFTPVYQKSRWMIYSPWDIECNRLKLVIMVILCPPPWKPKKSKFGKNEKNCWRYHHFTKLYLKPQSYQVWFLGYGVRNFFFILGHFLPFYPPNNPEFWKSWKIFENFGKMKKRIWRCHHFTHVYRKSQSYVCFLR